MSQSDESFYSIDGSKSEFTFVQQSPPKQPPPPNGNLHHLLNQFNIKQSSAIGVSEDQIEPSRQEKTLDRQGINLHDISAIRTDNELETSLNLQKQIDCLTVPDPLDAEQRDALNDKIDKLKKDQNHLQSQLEMFQSYLAVAKKNNEEIVKGIKDGRFVKKESQHGEGEVLSVRETIKQTFSPPLRTVCDNSGQKMYQVKPNRNQTAAEKELNEIYKQASFEGKAKLIEDNDNDYKVQATYGTSEVVVEVINSEKGETNFLYAGRINEQGQEWKKVSQKLVYPMKAHQPKKFTLSFSVVLLIFNQQSDKTEQNLIKMEEMKTITVPLPLNYLTQLRFTKAQMPQSFLARIRERMFVYEIDIGYQVDYRSYQRLAGLEWVRNKWVSLRGVDSLLWVEVGQLEERGADLGVGFKVGATRRDSEQAVDLIEYFCFMLTL